jgi:transcriptional regulator with XRE-family HTH domain
MVDPATAGPPDRYQQPRPLLRTVLGDVLRRTRREQRRTLADVADAAKVSMPYLSEVERGRKEASSEILAAICDALGIDLAFLLAEVGSGLLVDQSRRTAVVRLDAVRGHDAVRGLDAAGELDAAGDKNNWRARDAGSVTCLLAA